MAAAPYPQVKLCAHAPLARVLRAADDARQRAAGRESWPSAPIFTLDAWLERRWAAGGERLLLTDLQEVWLWREIIAAHAENRELVDLEATAAAAVDAWRRVQSWQLPLAGEAWQEREETAAFLSWAQQFRRTCQREGWLSSAELPAAVAAHLDRCRPPLPSAMEWLGFDELNPAQQELLSDLRAAGVGVDVVFPKDEAAEPQIHAFGSPDSELRAVAAWARALVELDPEANIGIVVPGLRERRAAVERILHEAFHPRRPPWDTAPSAFHLSLGSSLAEVPMLAAALRLLEVLTVQGPADLRQALDCIRSPFLAASDTEAAPRARLEHQLRAQQRELWSWPDLVQQIRRSCPQLAHGFAQAHTLIRRWPGRQSHQQWADVWARLWQALGWPGERPLESDGWPASAAWQRLLDDFGRLDQVAPEPVTAAAALAHLRRAAAAQRFQPQAPPAPVQVLGWLEASGLSFTHLWVCGLQENALPEVPHPHPFLPLRMQREQGVPHSSAEREADVATRLWERLRRRSREVHASFATTDTDGRLLLPSPLLAGMTATTHDAIASPASPAPMESLDDHLAPPAIETERSADSRLFLDQTNCPFRAFAHRRLHAASPSALATGLPATVRGTLLHRLLRALWFEAEAGDFSRSRLERLAAEVVAQERSLRGRPGLAATERARLTETALAWGEIERQRQPFRVLAGEDPIAAAFAGLNLQLRRDRIDELEDGRLALLDYKSGKCSPAMWREPYPEQPQLPLYVTTEARRARVAALAFAQVRSGDMKLTGLEKTPGTLLAQPLSQGRTQFPSWREQLARWQIALEALAAEYLRGEARVEPRQRQSCATCDLHALCRIREQVAAADDEEEPDGDAG